MSDRQDRPSTWPTDWTAPVPHARDPIPAAAGVGLRHPHVADFIEDRPKTGWLEIHSENYLCDGGPRLRQLELIRRDYPLSCHGVGLSLGSAEGLDADHLARLRTLFDRFEPGLVSEHVSWSVQGGAYLNDLLPLPYTEEALEVVCRNIDRAQEAFGRQLLAENPSTYMRFGASTLDEADFMAEIARRTGCGILLDINNVYVSAMNHGFDALAYVDAIPADAVGEIHMAGHARCTVGGGEILIDDHSSAPIAPVWELLDHALSRLGPRPVLIEWDGDIPDLPILLAEAAKAARALAGAGAAEAEDAA